MDYTTIEAKMKENYAAVARRYRENDDNDVTGPDHQRIAAILSERCCAFRRPISVLDLGCGTGRYFHALKNVQKLVGMDISEEMLSEARNPVCGEEISIPESHLICGNFYTTEFPDRSFDFIYSLGVFGNGCALTVELFNKFHRWLTPDGCLFLDAIDCSTEPWPARFRRQAKRFIHDRLPQRMQNAWDRRNAWLPFFLTSRKHLEKMLRQTKFPYFSVQSNSCTLPLGTGKKVECLAAKAACYLRANQIA